METVDTARMDKSVFEIKPMSEHGDDRAYWASKTGAERLAAVEFMRQVMYGYDPSTARIQRILTIAQQPWS